MSSLKIKKMKNQIDFLENSDILLEKREKKMLSSEYIKLSTHTTLCDLSESKYEEKRITSASHPLCPVHCLEMLMADESYKVRYCVATNPNVTLHILKKLCEDENKEVMKVAKENYVNKLYFSSKNEKTDFEDMEDFLKFF
jgi:hypothetical protein